MDSLENMKKRAAQAALEFVENNTTLGLGTGSTAAYFVKALARKVKDEKLSVKCVCTSNATEALAKKEGLSIIALNEAEKINLSVDGADEVDASKMLIKGYGGALTREKIIEYKSEKLVIIVDESKVSKKLSKPVPVEYLPFAHSAVVQGLEKLGAKKIRQRMLEGNNFESDNGFHIVDADFGEISNPASLEQKINLIPGVLENGIFSRGASVIVGGKEEVRKL
ncbi:ribose 5-phosphate isomerase A [Candidatus Micrarchaeota archaeon CG10_big_fil_rev_8_21_14_0_10_45_29]|nr:MAG: ribose 5-phosphate isomerase A [Candidatus Micrarchaeota archaeon CG10_big_fil_rev_8_21_14_0_10_45_29]QBM01562.1 ribose-5-phosphate isomerase A [uncultured archaeon]